MHRFSAWLAGMIMLLALHSACLHVAAAADGPATLFADINPTGSADPAGFTVVGSTLFFVADDGVHGRELWKSDGTSTGTMLVKDITPGAEGSYPSELTDVNGTLFFRGTYGNSNDADLWKSDGTEVGTVRVKDIVVGTDTTGPSELTNVNETLFFRANDATSGTELWKSDGTDAGTVRVKDIVVGAGWSRPAELTNVNGTLFFRVGGYETGYALWKSDGTEAGTVLLKEISSSTNSALKFGLTNVRGTLFLQASDATSGAELWKSDGTPTGTVLVKDIIPGTEGSYPFKLIDVNGTLFFYARSSLWKSDGTAVGTVPIKEFNVSAGSSSVSGVASVNGRLFFSHTFFTRLGQPVGSDLWTSDGTSAGTVFLYGSFDLYGITNVHGTLCLSAYSTSGDEFWTSDGTPEGTLMVQDLAPGAASSRPDGFTAFGTNVMFSANDGTHGRELWSIPLAALILPVAAPLTVHTRPNTPLSSTLPGRIRTGVPLSYRIVSPPPHGTATLLDPTTGTFTYTPQAAFTGTDTFTYAVSDGTRESSSATVTVSVSHILVLPLIGRS